MTRKYRNHGTETGFRHRSGQRAIIAGPSPAGPPMPFLIVSVLFSVLVGVLLKLAQRRGLGMVPVILGNYVAALLLCFATLDPPLARLGEAGTPWLSLALLMVLLPGIFLAMAASVRAAGIARTDVAQRLSLVVSLGAAFLFFGETANAGKLVGLLLGLIAIAGIVSRPRAGDTGPGNGARARWLLPLTVLLGYAAVDILLKRIAVAGTPFAASLAIAFAGALACMLALQAARWLRGSRGRDVGALLAGLLVGACNFANILFYIKAHQALPASPAVVFATMNLGVVVLGTLVGTFAFGEKLSRLNWLGIVLAVASVGLIAASL